MSLTNAEARIKEMCEGILAGSYRSTPSHLEHYIAEVARFTLARLGQEDVMDAEVVEIEKRHVKDEERRRDLYLSVTGDIHAVHKDRATLLKKIRAVTPAVTRCPSESCDVVDPKFCVRANCMYPVPSSVVPV